MAAKRDKSGAEVVMIAAEYGICTSRTGFVVEPENLRIRWVTGVGLY